MGCVVPLNIPTREPPHEIGQARSKSQELAGTLLGVSDTPAIDALVQPRKFRGFLYFLTISAPPGSGVNAKQSAERYSCHGKTNSKLC